MLTSQLNRTLTCRLIEEKTVINTIYLEVKIKGDVNKDS